MRKGRTDEPLATDADVRHERARRMASLLRTLHDVPPATADGEDELALWLAKCLLAHEVDTLALLMDGPRASRRVAGILEHKA